MSGALRGKVVEDSDAPAGRTLRRWIAAYCQAEAAIGSGYIGLLPAAADVATARPNCPKTSRTLIEETIAADYETLKQKTVYASWLALKLACDQKGVVLPSYKTYRLAVRRRPVLEQTLKRQGPRAAYQQEAAYWELEFRTPPHGDRPFEIAHIDHTELDVECVCSRTGRGLGTSLVNATDGCLLPPYAGAVSDIRCTQLSLLHDGAS